MEGLLQLDLVDGDRLDLAVAPQSLLDVVVGDSARAAVEAHEDQEQPECEGEPHARVEDHTSTVAILPMISWPRPMKMPAPISMPIPIGLPSIGAKYAGVTKYMNTARTIGSAVIM